MCTSYFSQKKKKKKKKERKRWNSSSFFFAFLGEPFSCQDAHRDAVAVSGMLQVFQVS